MADGTATGLVSAAQLAAETARLKADAERKRLQVRGGIGVWLLRLEGAEGLWRVA
jgi:hypothetical protein